MLSMHHYKTAAGKQLCAENECPCMDSPPLGRKLIVRFINAIDRSQHKITCIANSHGRRGNLTVLDQVHVFNENELSRDKRMRFVLWPALQL